MRTKNIIIQFLPVTLVVLVLLAACKKSSIDAEAPRLFRPVIKNEMESLGNWVSASWQTIKDAAGYRIQISRDTFQTIDVTLDVDTSVALFEDLRWNQLYQVQVLALAPDTSRNSKWSFLGEIKTAKFPSILQTSSNDDIIDNALIVRWVTGGDPVSALKVLKLSDSSLVADIPLTPADISNEYKLVTGLTGNTEYIIYLYSGTKIRGWDNYKTKPSLAFAPGSNIIDLRGNPDPSSLSTELSSAPSGSVIILQRGMSYDISSQDLSGSVTIVSGLDFDPVANINITSQFDIADGAVIDSIVFSNVSLTGEDFGGDYAFNISRSCTIGKIMFESCNIKNFRGVCRIKASSPVVITDYIYNKCIIDSINNYGVLNVDNSAATVENVYYLNSTIYKVQQVLVSKSASNSITIDNCTFGEAPLNGNYFIDYKGKDVASFVKIHNTILGPGWIKVGGTSSDVRGTNFGSANVDVSNTYSTADYNATSNALPNLVSYSQESGYIWQDPLNGNFTIVDQTFPGKSTAGDPRWRP